MLKVTSIRVTCLAVLLNITAASQFETIQDFTPIWKEDFSGTGSINLTNWQYYTGAIFNNEQESYLLGNANCRLSGQGSLLILPENSNGQWTSCRIETVSSFQASPGGQIIVQARFKLGTPGANLQGIWPAFWSLGESMRNGVSWPECGEIDTFENVNGGELGYGTLHCGSTCLGDQGLSLGANFDYGSFHTWAHAIDLRESQWEQQSITWYMDGQPYHILHGSDLGNEDDWAAVAHNPMYMTLNVAVGGSWPGPASSGTASGKNAGMEILYVAVYGSD